MLRVESVVLCEQKRDQVEKNDDEKVEDEEQEVPQVFDADAVVDPRTMVVH